MNEDEFKSHLQQMYTVRDEDTYRPMPDAKKRAIELALAEFDAAGDQVQKKNRSFFQGIMAYLRHKLNPSLKTKDKTMNKTSQPWIFGAASAAFALVLTFTLLPFEQQGQIPPRTEETLLPMSQVASNKDGVLSQERELQENGQAKSEAKVEMDAVAGAPNRSEQASISAFSDSMAPQVSESRHAPALNKMSLSRIAPAHLEPAYMPPVQGREVFPDHNANPVKKVSEEPVSTFSIDVDTASYSFARRSLNEGRLPPKDAIRIEEMVNYFDYKYPNAASPEQPFNSTVTVLPSPWKSGNKLVHVGIRAFDLEAKDKPRSNLVFLLDVSGSMNSADKLPLVKQSMHMLLNELDEDDTVAIAVYAGAAGTVLEPTPVKERAKILAALKKLQAGGSTAGAEGIELAYQLAETHFDKNAVNRIFLATDGDFNVGITNTDELKSYVERKRKSGVFLSILGFGRGNYNDQLMQALAQNGNGVAAYIDTLGEAQKVLVQEASAALFPVAKDVKIQLEFNPETVDEYRLIGYETRALKNEDFNNDKVDAGDIGAGHTVTAIYEITPTGSNSGLIDELRYAKKPNSQAPAVSEYGFLKLRYKLPDGEQSRLLETPISIGNTIEQQGSLLVQEVNFSAAVAGFSQLIKDEKYLHDWGFDDALALAQENKGRDLFGYRAEFVQLIRKAKLATEL